MNMTLLIPSGDTLVTYYVLPLLGLNKKSFGSKFDTSLLDFDERVYVRLKGNMIVPTYKDNENYLTTLSIEDKTYVVFSVPSEFINEYKLFLEGKYSHFSKEAKEIIFNTSTLPYNKRVGKFSMSHPILQGLDKTKTLRNFLKKFFDVSELADSGELIDKPAKDWFIEYYIEQNK